jgi:hypothetical protein
MISVVSVAMLVAWADLVAVSILVSTDRFNAQIAPQSPAGPGFVAVRGRGRNRPFFTTFPTPKSVYPSEAISQLI